VQDVGRDEKHDRADYARDDEPRGQIFQGIHSSGRARPLALPTDLPIASS
jgi:hypothetical protein